MSIAEIFVYSIGIVYLPAAFAFAFYAIGNARLMRGPWGHRLMAFGAVCFIAAALIGVANVVFFPYSDLVYISGATWMAGLLLIVTGGYQRGRNIQKVLCLVLGQYGVESHLIASEASQRRLDESNAQNKVHRISLFKMFFIFRHGKFYLVAISVLVLGIPAYLVDLLSPPGYDWLSAGIVGIWAFAFGALAIAERMFYHDARPSAATAAPTALEELLLRDDIRVTRAYTYLTNRFLTTVVPVIGTTLLKNTLSKCAEERDILKGFEMTGEGILKSGNVEASLMKGDEKKNLQRLYDAFSTFNSKIIVLYSAIVSPKLAKETFANIYKDIKEKYKSLEIFPQIVKGMPEGVLDEERLAILSKEELEEKVREKTKELKEAYDKIISAQKYTDNIVRSMADSLIVVSPEGNILTVNAATCTLLGYEEKELVGQPMGKIVVEEELQFKKAEIEELIKKGFIRNLEITYLSRDGRKIPMLFSGSVMRDDDGKTQGIMCVAQNITERKRAEETLAKERNLLRTLIDNLPNSHIFVKDTHSRFITTNAAHLKTIGAKILEDVIGKTDFDLFPQELAAQYYADEQEVIRSGQPLINREELVIDKAGNRRWLLTTKAPLRDSSNSVVGIVGMSRDITDLKGAYALLEQRNKELQSFVYTVSHDLKAPLVSLEGFSSMLIDKYKESLDETGQLYLSRIQANAQKMGDLIQDLLELSRIGRVVHDYEPVDVMEIIQEAIETLQIQLSERGTELVIHDNLPTIVCDRVRIKQVFLNLIDNANKFMGEENQKPRIEIGFHAESPDADRGKGDFFEFFVKDNGIGIKKEYHEKVFEIFTRLGDVQVEGTGVGLAIVKKIIETHGGKIWLDSEVGKGTTVYFTLPKSSYD